MQNQTLQENNGFQSQFSTKLAIGSFLIGTLIFVLFQLHPENDFILIYGFAFVILAFIVNGIVALNLLHLFIVTPLQRELLTIKLLIVLSNIPIAIGYYYLLFA